VSPGQANAWVEVDLGAIQHNLRELSSQLPQRRLLLDVSCDAHEHGLAQVVGKIERSSWDVMYRALDQGEAADMRSVSDAPILFPYLPGRRSPMRSHAAFVYVPRGASVEDIELESTIIVRLDIDIDLVQTHRAAEQIAEYVKAGVGIRGVHFGYSPMYSGIHSPMAVELCADFVDALRAVAPVSDVIASMHLAKLDERADWFSVAEIRNEIYSLASDDGPEPEGLRLAKAVKTLVNNRRGSLAIIPLGYASGLSPVLKGQPVLIGGEHVPLADIWMHESACDVAALGDSVHQGDEVVIVGRQGLASISYVDATRGTDLTPHELLLKLGGGLTRVFVD